MCNILVSAWHLIKINDIFHLVPCTICKKTRINKLIGKTWPIVPWHYLQHNKKAFFGVSLEFMLPQITKKRIYFKKKKVKMHILPGTD